LQIDYDEVMQCLEDMTSREGMAAWLISNKQESVKDARLPLCLCVIEESENSWEVTCFLSPFVGEYVQVSVLARLNIKRRTFLDLLKIPYCFGFIRTMFEGLSFKVLGLEGRILVEASQKCDNWIEKKYLD
jgi:hypothetical protein